MSLKFVYIAIIHCEKQCIFKVAKCVHMVHRSVIMGMKNAHSAIDFENTTHVKRNIFDQKNLGKLSFINAYNL